MSAVVYDHSDIYTYTGAALHGLTVAFTLVALIITMNSRHAEKTKKKSVESWTYWLGDTIVAFAIGEILITIGLAISADGSAWISKGIAFTVRTQLILWFLGAFARAISFAFLFGAIVTLSGRMLRKDEPLTWTLLKYAAWVAVIALDLVVFIFLCSWLSRYVGWINAGQDASEQGEFDWMLQRANIVYFVVGILELLLAFMALARTCVVLSKCAGANKRLALRMLVMAAGLMIIPAVMDTVFGAYATFVNTTAGTDIYSAYNYSLGQPSVILGVILISWPIFAGLVCVFLAANRAWPGKDDNTRIKKQLGRFGPIPFAGLMPGR